MIEHKTHEFRAHGRGRGTTDIGAEIQHAVAAIEHAEALVQPDPRVMP